MGDREMAMFVGQFPELGGVPLRMCAVEIKPTSDTVMVAFILAVVAPFVSGHTMENLDFDAREEIRHPIPGNKGRNGVVLHNLCHRFQVLFVGSQRG